VVPKAGGASPKDLNLSELLLWDFAADVKTSGRGNASRTQV